MSEKTELAAQKHRKGYNCAQAVACSFCDMTGLDEQQVFKLTEGLGLGMGSMKGICGALSGACAVLGFLNSTGNLETPNSKKDTYKKVKELSLDFEAAVGAIACKDIKTPATGKVLKTCPECIEIAVELLEKAL